MSVCASESVCGCNCLGEGDPRAKVDNSHLQDRVEPTTLNLVNLAGGEM